MIHKVVIFLFALAAVCRCSGATDRSDVCVTGVVTCARSGEHYFTLTALDGRNAMVECPFGTVPEFRRGDVVSASGHVLESDRVFRVRDAQVERLDRNPELVPKAGCRAIDEICRISVTNGTAQVAWGRRYVTEGAVKDIVRRGKNTLILLRGGASSLQAVVGVQETDPLPEGLALESRVRVEGVFAWQPVRNPWTKELVDVESLVLHVESVDDVTVVSRPPWWTVERLWIALAFVLLLSLALALLAALLFHRRHQDERVNDALRRERLRLSHDLHDNYQQLLAGCMFRLGAAQSMLPADATGDSARGQLEALGESLVHAQHDLRAALWSMAEESEGPKALSSLFKYALSRMPHWAGRVTFTTIGEEQPLSRRYAGGLLMILQEAVWNALKHADAQTVEVKVAFSPHQMTMSICDDGCGFEAERYAGPATAAARGLGLVGMRKRAEGFGGRFTIASEPGKGTVVRVEVSI